MSDTATVRLLIPDLDEDNPIFSDPQIEIFLSLNNGDVRLAAAEALEVAATDEAMVFKITRADDQSVNGVAGAKLLLERAAQLRADAWGGAFDVFYPVGPSVVPEATARPWGWR